MLLAGTDPQRLLQAAPNGYALAVDDEARRTYRKTDARGGVFEFSNDTLGPWHHKGTFEAALATVCRVQPKVEIESHSLLDFALHLRW
jgi:uncharacterized protein (TIGR02265 family)